MSDEKSLKLQRDRFLAFSFASADLFLEISNNDSIIFAFGASKGLTGIDEKTVTGLPWLDLFEKLDRPVLRTMYNQAKPVKRCGPVLVNLNKDLSNGKKVVVTGIKMPESDSFYITIGLSNMLNAKLGASNREVNETMALDKESFIDAANEALKAAKSLGHGVEMTLLDIQANDADIERMGQENWDAIQKGINGLLLSNSVDGEMAAEIADGRYSILHDEDIDSETLTEQIQVLAQEQDPDGQGLDVQSKTVTADLSTLSERDSAKALLYTINEFERKGTELTIENLNSGFKTYLAANAQKIKEFQSVIERLNFTLHFQPIVNLKTLEATHYEMLCRFDEGNTMEWVTFGEDIGMAAEFDIAVCERAINYIAYKAGGLQTKFSINISGQSIQSEDFFNKLTNLLDKQKNLQKRILFEITESSHIEDLEKVSSFIQRLRASNFEIALDDFGAGSASFQYLQELDVDYLKIDGKYIRSMLSSHKNMAMIKNLVQMCKDLQIKVVAEFVEDEAQLQALRDLGVDYGQGYLLGKPAPKLDYKPPANISPEE